MGTCSGWWGLSPLARGNLHLVARHQVAIGPIPARAGQPAILALSYIPLEAYPRSRGATNSRGAHLLCRSGLSPLARGNLAVAQQCALWAGPIPARAGQPMSSIVFVSSNGAYPRSRGATAPINPISSAPYGLSPLARGNRRRRGAAAVQAGPIPARAGQPPSCGCVRAFVRAYPRSRGAT